MKYRIVSLGCPKNLVDSEHIAGRLEKAGHTLAEDADLVVINTCAFIADACSESIETILGEAQKKAGPHSRLAVAGCLIDRYGDELTKLLPEVDVFLNSRECAAIERLVGESRTRPGGEEVHAPRKVLTALPTAYLKIQEGCNNRCSYCTIPSIKGPLQSRRPSDIEEEFRDLLSGGYREFNVIGQDITSYGSDGGSRLGKLLSRLLSVKGDYFLRLLYLHPKGIDDALLDIVKSDERIIPYLDVPIQHSEDRILASMNRGYSRAALERLFQKIKSDMPEAALRTTVMVGYPGETEEDFENLHAFVAAWEFDNLGAFMYSREEGTAASRIKGQTPKAVKKQRHQKIMELQREISKKRLKRLKGRHMPVVVEAAEADGMTGRLLLQAPDVDGLAFIKGECEVGQIRLGVVTATTDYDVIVELED